MEKEWTFDVPTEEGLYWLEEGIGKDIIVQVKKFNEGNNLAAFFPGEKIPTFLKYLKGSKWCGPITAPPKDKLREKTDEK